MADGSIQVYPTDSAATRYLDMPAVWDWHSLPGISAPTDTPFLACDPKISEAIGYNWPLAMGGTSFVGGASDGESGATAIKFGPTGPLKNGGFTLSRSHFVFDNTVVVLGVGLRATSKVRRFLFMSVIFNRKWRMGTLFVCISTESETNNKSRWLWRRPSRT